MSRQVRFSNLKPSINQGSGKQDDSPLFSAPRSTLGSHINEFAGEQQSQTAVGESSLLEAEESDLDTDDLELLPRFLVNSETSKRSGLVNSGPRFMVQAATLVVVLGVVGAGATLFLQSLIAAKASVAAIRLASSADWVRSAPEIAGAPNLVAKVRPGVAGEVSLARADESQAAPLSLPIPVSDEIVGNDIASPSPANNPVATSGARIAKVLREVSLKKTPAARGLQVATLHRGVQVQIVRCRTWCEVTANGKRGWVSRRFLSLGPG